MQDDNFGPSTLEQKFPDMKPISGPPSLFTINGVGCTMYGNRDYDAETGSYVATHFICVVFIPVIALGAYRVADAQEGGWYFLGKVPLSTLTRGWNVSVLLSVLIVAMGIWWNHHATDPDTLAAKVVADGDRLAAEGKVGAAAQKYQQIANNTHVGASHDAFQKLCALFGDSLDSAEPLELMSALRIGVDSYKLKKQPDKILDVALRQAQLRSEKDAQTAWKILDLVEPIAAPEDKRVVQAKKPILEKLVARDPDNIDALSDLALCYESEKQLERCEKLLTPRRADLGAREAARILGQILHGKGQFEQALPLLQAYAEERLERLHAAEESLKRTVKSIDESVIAQLKIGAAPGFDFVRFKALQGDPLAQNAMANDYINRRLRDDPEFKRGQEALLRESRVVPVAFDLGIALLQRGQALADPEARKKELEKAEKTFLRISGQAGQSDRFRLSLGQVYYWLGRPAEGRKLFDEVLKDNDPDRRNLVEIAQVLRGVGAVAEARKLAEDAFDNEINGGARDNIARTRALMGLDLDDRIKWLTRVANADRHDKADLCAAKGNKALMENRDADAERELREAIQHYAALPESAGTLNNSALACFSLYRATGDIADMNLGIAHLERAVALLPRDPIVLRNAADMRIGKALRGVIGDSLDWKTLKVNGSMDLIGFLYNDPAKKEHYRALIRKDEGVAQARSYYERLLVLAPRNAYQYSVLNYLHTTLNDRAALKQLQERLATADLDHADTIRRAEEAHADKDLDKRIHDLEHGAAHNDLVLLNARKVGGVTFAVAVSRFVRDRAGLFSVGRKIDADLVVKLADEAYKAAPSRGSQGILVEALLLRAHRDLVKLDPSYEAMSKKCLRSLGPNYLIPIALGKGGELQNACLELADVQRVCALLKSQCETYDDEFDDWDWAILRHVEPQWAEAQAQRMLKDELAAANRAILNRVTVRSASEAYRRHWVHLMQGNQAEADAVLRRAAKEGVPLPD